MFFGSLQCVPGSGARPEGGETDSHAAPARGTDCGGPRAHDAGRGWVQLGQLQGLGCEFYIELAKMKPINQSTNQLSLDDFMMLIGR